MGGITVLNVQKRGRATNIGPQDTIGDEIVGWSLCNPNLLIQRQRPLWYNLPAEQCVQF